MTFPYEKSLSYTLSYAYYQDRFHFHGHGLTGKVSIHMQQSEN